MHICYNIGKFGIHAYFILMISAALLFSSGIFCDNLQVLFYNVLHPIKLKFLH